MSENTRAPRPRLTLGGRVATAAATTRTTDTASTPRTTASPEPIRRPGPRTDRSIASVLDPVRSHFDLSDDKADELAAFARMLLSGAPPRMARG